jgi:type III restriction enzyme
MLEILLANRVREWLALPQCPARPLLAYMRSRSQLREVQIQALETYLYLLLEGRNRPLADLWMQGLFAENRNYLDASSRMPVLAQQKFTSDAAARTWHQWLQSQPPSAERSQLIQWLEDHATQINFAALTAKMFYGWQNTDYVFSLPMGAGKTWLMAAMIYLNLHLGDLHPGDERFARNFAVLIPSAKKSSILPSLRSIERFDPAAVIAEPAASQWRSRLHFEVLDAAKTAARSNQIRNPNVRKVAQHLADPHVCGLVLVVNAEKVILDRMDDNAQAEMLERTEDERDLAANELRSVIGRTPGLMLLVDEVHGAAHDEIRLRQVIQRWHGQGRVHSVLGFSGTPYLDKPLQLEIGPHRLKQTQMSTVVHHYPLVQAVQTFLKIPEVKTAHGLDAAQIVSQGAQEFFQKYGALTYADGCAAKLAIYCSSIERLENEVYPLVQHLAPGRILKYHRGNSQFKAPAGAESQFAALDSPASPYRIVLLVQIGKEGWDCKSLTGVILAQKGDSPSNMVLQTACRCLREAGRGQRHRALIYLSADNAAILETQLKSTQNTSIAQINAAALGASDLRPSHHRAAWLTAQQQLPRIETWQLRLHSQHLHIEQQAQTQTKLRQALHIAGQRGDAHLATGDFSGLQARNHNLLTLGDVAEFSDWLSHIVHESAGFLSMAQLREHSPLLQDIFEALCEPDSRVEIASSHFAQPILRYQTLAPQAQVRSLIRMAFWPERRYESQIEPLPNSCELRLLKDLPLPSVPEHDKLYPSAAQSLAIIEADAKGVRGSDLAQAAAQEHEKARAALAAAGFAEMAANLPSRAPDVLVQAKEQSFHYLPYDFSQSGLELGLLDQLLRFDEFRRSGLEMYYNGARGLTEFRIDCFTQLGASRWQRIGLYTPDFLLLSRHPKDHPDAGKARQVLIIEAKGAGFAQQTNYTQRRDFVQGEFLRINNEKFGYARFDFVQIDEPPLERGLPNYRHAAERLRQHASAFFGIAC